MRIVGWDSDLINKLRTQALKRAARGHIVRVAGNRDGLINGAHERRNGAARLQRVTMASKRLGNLKPNMTSTNVNMLRITDAKINVPGVRTGHEDTKVEGRNESARGFARHNSTELQRDFARRQRLRRL